MQHKLKAANLFQSPPMEANEKLNMPDFSQFPRQQAATTSSAPSRQTHQFQAPTDDPNVIQAAITEGNWQYVEQCLVALIQSFYNGTRFLNGSTFVVHSLYNLLFKIHQQVYLEALERNDTQEALRMLNVIHQLALKNTEAGAKIYTDCYNFFHDPQKFLHFRSDVLRVSSMTQYRSQIANDALAVIIGIPRSSARSQDSIAIPTPQKARISDTPTVTTTPSAVISPKTAVTSQHAISPLSSVLTSQQPSHGVSNANPVTVVAPTLSISPSPSPSTISYVKTPLKPLQTNTAKVIGTTTVLPKPLPYCQKPCFE